MRKRDPAKPARSFADKEEWKAVLTALQQASKLTYDASNDTVLLISNATSNIVASSSTAAGDDDLTLDQLLAQHLVLVKSVRVVMKSLSQAARCDDPPSFLSGEKCTFNDLLKAVQDKCNVESAELEQM